MRKICKNFQILKPKPKEHGFKISVIDRNFNMKTWQGCTWQGCILYFLLEAPPQPRINCKSVCIVLQSYVIPMTKL